MTTLLEQITGVGYVLYALDRDGYLWRYVNGEWELVGNPEENA